jgi:hypothetical protein
MQEKKVIPNYNIRTLYKGLSAPLVGVGIEKGIVFGVYEMSIKHTQKLCKNICDDKQTILLASNALSGGLSVMCASFIVTPFERIKILSALFTAFISFSENISLYFTIKPLKLIAVYGFKFIESDFYTNIIYYSHFQV